MGFQHGSQRIFKICRRKALQRAVLQAVSQPQLGHGAGIGGVPLKKGLAVLDLSDKADPVLATLVHDLDEMLDLDMVIHI